MAIELRGSGAIEDEAVASSKPTRVEKITAALTAIDTDGTVSDCIAETPGAFLWEFYKAWVENGGQDGGKNRNSIRRMREVWLIGAHEVKSLHPKLTGKIRISEDDAKALVNLFLGRWEFVGIKEGDWILTPDGYAPFACNDRKTLCERLVDAMYPSRSNQANLGLLLPIRKGEGWSKPNAADFDTLTNLYRNMDAHIIISRHNSTIGPTPSDTIRLFWEAMNYMYETIGSKKTTFIWIVDIGRRQVEDETSWKDFFNFEMMKTQFRAFASFDSGTELEEVDRERNSSNSHQRSGIHDAFLRSLTIPEEGSREKRWKWLCERSVVIIQNLRREEFEHFYKDEDQQVERFRLRDIGVTAENILPSMIPNRWLGLRELRDLYGNDLTEISDATLTVHVDTKQSHDSKDGLQPVRYFAHALSPSLEEYSPFDTAERAYELPSPGALYDEAINLAYWAARHRLKKFDDDSDEQTDKNAWAIAAAYLKNQGFRVIRLPEFMRIHRSPGD